MCGGLRQFPGTGPVPLRKSCTTEQIPELLARGGIVVGPTWKRSARLASSIWTMRPASPKVWRPRRGLFGGDETFIPLDMASAREETIHMPYDK